jgi:Sulfotransferase family
MTGRRFFFIHVMKTAGGTLSRQIIANFGRQAVYPFARHPPDIRAEDFSIAYLTALPEERRARIRVFTGHFPFVAVELLGMRLTTITLLRDPVERTISYLRHCKHHHERHRGLSLEEIYEDPLFYPCFIENHQAKMFALTAEDEPETYMDTLDVDHNRLELAKANLERVDVLGTQDRFDELLGELEQRFGWRCAEVANKNVASGGEARVPASFRRRIAEDNAADMEFFEHARILCERRRAVGAAS